MYAIKRAESNGTGPISLSLTELSQIHSKVHIFLAGKRLGQRRVKDIVHYRIDMGILERFRHIEIPLADLGS